MSGAVDLSSFFLTGMVAFGAPALGLALLAGALGAPLPSSLLVLAAGAFARQGSLDGASAFLLSIAGVVAGDSLSFMLGKRAAGWAERGRGGSRLWRQAQRRFGKNGGLSIFLTRFALTPLAVPVNLIAGGSGYGFRRFLSYDLAGELVWLGVYGGLGYAFWSQWEALGERLGDLSSALLGLAALGAAACLILWRVKGKQKAILG